MDIGYILNEARTRGLTTCEIMLWIALAYVADQLGSTFAASSYDLEKITGMSRTSLLRSRQALRDEGIITYEVNGRHPAIYTLRGEIVVRSRLDENPEIQGKTEDVVRSRLDRGEIEPFSPHTPLNPKRNNIYSTYSSLNEEHNEEENVRIERERKVTEKKRKVQQKPRIEREHYAEFVTLTKQEYDRLVERFGEAPAKRMIEILDNYKGATGKKYDCDYRAILNWVVRRYEEEQSRPSAASADKRATDQHYARNSMDFFAEGFDI